MLWRKRTGNPSHTQSDGATSLKSDEAHPQTKDEMLPLDLKILETPKNDKHTRTIESAITEFELIISRTKENIDKINETYDISKSAISMRKELEKRNKENDKLVLNLVEVQIERDKLKDNNSKLYDEDARLKNSIESLNGENRQRNKQIDELKKTIDELNIIQKNNEEKIIKNTEQLELYKSNIKDLKIEIDKLENDLREARSEASSQSIRADRAEKSQKDTSQEIAQMRKQISGMLRATLLNDEVDNKENKKDTIDVNILDNKLPDEIKYDNKQ